MEKKVVVLIAVPDQIGLINKITGVIFQHGFNITETNEFVDHSQKRFFMRLQLEGKIDCDSLERALRGILTREAYLQVRELKPRRLMLMASKEPHCLGDLLLRHSLGELKADILSVISQHNDCLELSKRFEIPYHYVSTTGLSREDHESQIVQLIESYEPEYIVLARYMRVLTETFVARYPQKIINIHHSFLPAFVGKNPYEQAHTRGVKVIGATAHFVTADLDQGPIITQDVIPVNHSLNPKEMSRRGQDVEKIVLFRALKLALEDRLLIDCHRSIIFE